MLTIPRAALELHRFTFEDDDDEGPAYNPSLACILVECNKGYAIAVATDGHRLQTVRWEAKGDAIKGLIPAHLARAALFEASGSWEVGWGLRITIQRSDGFHVSDMAPDLLERFPNWRKVIPEPKNGEAKAERFINLDTRYLLGLSEYCEAADAAVDRVALGESALDPVRFDLSADGCGEIVHVLMPLRT